MISNNLVDATTLKNNNLQKRHIDDNIQEIVLRINSELRISQKLGNHHIITELPIIYDIPNMTNKDAQRIIWSSLIELLKNKNYVVFINTTKDNCRLKISWLNPEDEILIKNQYNILTQSARSF